MSPEGASLGTFIALGSMLLGHANEGLEKYQRYWLVLQSHWGLPLIHFSTAHGIMDAEGSGLLGQVSASGPAGLLWCDRLVHPGLPWPWVPVPQASVWWAPCG